MTSEKNDERLAEYMKEHSKRLEKTKAGLRELFPDYEELLHAAALLQTQAKENHIASETRASTIVDTMKPNYAYGMVRRGWDHFLEHEIGKMNPKIAGRFADCLADQGLIPRQAAKGVKFQSGKAEGAKGPFRKRIDALLKKNPAMKNPELWAAIAKKPPQGWVAMDNRAGKYFERQNPDGGMESFDYTTFIKRASEARKSLKKA